MSSDYNDHSAPQRVVLQLPVRLLAKSLPASSDPTAPFVYLDLGCATGANAIPPIEALLEALEPERELSVILNDLPANAWSVVVDTVTVPLLKQHPKRLTISLAPRSFYEPVVPSGSVDLCFSSTALHWGPDPRLGRFAGSAERFRTMEPLHFDDSTRSFATLVDLAVTALRPGGMAVWSVPCLSSEEDMDQALADCVRPYFRFISFLG